MIFWFDVGAMLALNICSDTIIKHMSLMSKVRSVFSREQRRPPLEPIETSPRRPPRTGDRHCKVRVYIRVKPHVRSEMHKFAEHHDTNLSELTENIYETLLYGKHAKKMRQLVEKQTAK